MQTIIKNKDVTIFYQDGAIHRPDGPAIVSNNVVGYYTHGVCDKIYINGVEVDASSYNIPVEKSKPLESASVVVDKIDDAIADNILENTKPSKRFKKLHQDDGN